LFTFCAFYLVSCLLLFEHLGILLLLSSSSVPGLEQPPWCLSLVFVLVLMLLLLLLLLLLRLICTNCIHAHTHAHERSRTHAHTTNIRALTHTHARSADSCFLVTGSSDHTAKLWDVHRGQIIKNYRGHHKVRGAVVAAVAVGVVVVLLGLIGWG
jgi:WD40 repeat protein